MVERARKPSQPTRTMVLALFLVPWSVWTLLLAGMYAGTPRGWFHLFDGSLAFIGGFLILGNMMAGRWLATLWGGMRVLFGVYILVLTLGFRGIGSEWVMFGSVFGFILLGLGVLAVWMAFPLPHERAAYRDARNALREEKMALKAATEGI